VAFSFAGAVIHGRILPRDLKAAFFLKHRAYDTAKARRLLGFAPQVRLDEGLPRTIAWYRAQGWL